MSKFHVTERLVDTVKEFEGFHSKAYWDKFGKVWTVGWGRTGDVHEGDTTDREFEDAWLRYDLARRGREIEKMVTVPMAQNQFEALVSFSYNTGLGGLRRSTLLKRFNACDHSAHEEFDRWVHAKGQVEPVPGLVNRRKREREWFIEHLRES